MVNFLQPVWLYTMLGVAVPIAIHLFNIQQGKILKVGSVALLAKNAAATTSRLKLHQLLLLLLRCLFIILLALVLAQPRWQGNSAKQQGWVLLDSNYARQTYAHYKQPVDSLLAAGCQLHYFNAGFAMANVKQLAANDKDALQTNYWATLQQLQKAAGAQTPLYIFTNAYIKNIAGNRPAAMPNVHWYSYAPGDTLTYSAGSYAIQGDSMLNITAHTAAMGTYNTYNTVPRTNGTDTSTLYVTVYTKTYNTDAACIKAAVDAIKQFTKRKIVTTLATGITQIPAQQQWLFWLADEAVPGNIKAQNKLLYASGKTEDVQTWVNPSANETNNFTPVNLTRRVAVKSNEAGNVWVDGYGNGVLTKNDKNEYVFFSRFDAAWNDLPWSSNFPQMIYALMFPGDGYAINSNDRRVVNNNQLQPYLNSSKAGMQQVTAGTDAAPLLWLLVFIIFFVERIIALRAKKERANV